jgi:hypothetical protein
MEYSLDIFGNTLRQAQGDPAAKGHAELVEARACAVYQFPKMSIILQSDFDKKLM